MTVRRGTVADLAAICEIEAASFGDPWSERDFRAAFDDPICEYAIAEDGGAVIGYALYSAIYEDAEIMSLAVLPQMRRRGVGRALLSRVIECVTVRGAETLFLEVRASNDAAIALYGSFGFERLRVIRNYYREPTEDAVAMSLALDAAK